MQRAKHSRSGPKPPPWSTRPKRAGQHPQTVSPDEQLRVQSDVQSDVEAPRKLPPSRLSKCLVLRCRRWRSVSSVLALWGGNGLGKEESQDHLTDGLSPPGRCGGQGSASLCTSWLWPARAPAQAHGPAKIGGTKAAGTQAQARATPASLITRGPRKIRANRGFPRACPRGALSRFEPQQTHVTLLGSSRRETLRAFCPTVLSGVDSIEDGAH